jgi:hypothetical protein
MAAILDKKPRAPKRIGADKTRRFCKIAGQQVAVETEQLPSGVEERARSLLKLQDVDRTPNALPIRNDWLWRAEHFAPRVAYSASLLLPLGRAPRLDAAAKALNTLVARHEALRSKLTLENDIPVLLPQQPEIDLACAMVPKADIAAQREGRPAPALSPFFTKPIELYEQAGFRVKAVMDEEGDVHLAILVHHYYGDAWSSQILRREFSALYAAEKDGPALPPAAQYSEYGLFQRRALEKSLTRQLNHWHRTLRDAEAARLPYDTDSTDPMLGRVFFLVEEEVMQKLDALAKTQRVSLGLVCYAALQIALARWCGQPGMVSGLIAANRIRPQFQATVGSLLSIIPVASSIGPDMPFRAFLMGFAKSVFDGIAHQDISVDNYNDIFRPPLPLGEPRFNFVPRQENFFVGAGETPSIAGVQAASDIKRNSAYTDLHVLMLEYPKGLLGRVNHGKLLSFPAIKRLIEIWQGVLQHIAANSDASLGSL